MSLKPAAITLIYSDSDQKLQTAPDLLAVGCNGRQVEVADTTWIDLPAGGELLQLPGRLPLGFNLKSDQVEVVEATTAVAAILPVGYTRSLLPGYELAAAGELPLFGYTAVGSSKGKLKVAAFQTDASLKWDPAQYNTADLPLLITAKRQFFPQNRILEQLAKCSLEYHCLTAQNIFYNRWEAGIPVSPVCNADCLGCISLQPAECCPAPQGRISFVPSAREIIELAVGHLDAAAEAIVSFGQGCEGEPSLQLEVLAPALKEIRRQTKRGTINLNTNAGDPAAIKTLSAAGLDSIRVSLFSARPANYRWYHRPVGFGLAEVIASLQAAVTAGVKTALNLLLFPGFTNQPAETAALDELIAHTGLHQLQLRNLNLDPERLAAQLVPAELPGIPEWLAQRQRNFPHLTVGNYSRPLDS